MQIALILFQLTSSLDSKDNEIYKLNASVSFVFVNYNTANQD